MKNRLWYCNIRSGFQTKWKISNFFTFKDKISSLFTNFSVVAAMLPNMTKLNAILWPQCVNTWEFLHSLGKELKVMMILPLTDIFYSAIAHLILKISQFLLPTAATLKIGNGESSN